MSELFVSRVLLEVNGQSVTDFASVEENEYEVYKPVNLMNGTGHCKVTERYGLKLDYVRPRRRRGIRFHRRGRRRDRHRQAEREADHLHRRLCDQDRRGKIRR